jgi:hypothetical protein
MIKRDLAILHRFRIQNNVPLETMTEDSVASHDARLEARFKAREACHKSARCNQ